MFDAIVNPTSCGGGRISLSLTLDFQFTTSIEKLWSALTDSSKLAKWIMENDFEGTEILTFITNTSDSQMLKESKAQSMAGVNGSASLKKCWNNNLNG